MLVVLSGGYGAIVANICSKSKALGIVEFCLLLVRRKCLFV